MGLLQRADLAEMKRLKIPYRIGARSIDELRADLADGALPLARGFTAMLQSNHAACALRPPANTRIPWLPIVPG
jgi:hypothetical protein